MILARPRAAQSNGAVNEHEVLTKDSGKICVRVTDQATDDTPVQCLLEMTEDSQVTVVLRPGCSVDDVEDMLRMLTLAGGDFKHFLVRDEY
jgi:hypothetical protein